jgi:hypothetical protein
MIPLEDVIDDCLEQLENGTATVEQCLARYPQHAAELRPLLMATMQFQPARTVTARSTFKTRNRAQLIAHMGEHPRGRRQAASPFFQFFQSGFKVAFSLGAVAVALLVVSTGAAQSAMPGQPLYGLKRTSENVWRAVSPDPLSVDLAISERRAEELVQVHGTDAESSLLQDYQDALEQLDTYNDADDQELIANSLSAQQQELQQGGVIVPTLEQLLDLAPLTLTPTTEVPIQLEITEIVPVVETILPELATNTPKLATSTVRPSSTYTSTSEPPPPTTRTPEPVLPPPLPTLPLPVPTLEVPPVIETAVPPVVSTIVGGVGDVVETVLPDLPLLP